MNEDINSKELLFNKYFQILLNSNSVKSFEKLVLLSLEHDGYEKEKIFEKEINFLKMNIEYGFFEDIENSYSLNSIFEYALIVSILSNKGFLTKFSKALNEYLYEKTIRVVSSYEKFDRKYFFEIFPIIAKIINFLNDLNFDVTKIKFFLINNISFKELEGKTIPKFYIRDIDINFRKKFPKGIIPLGMAHGSLGVLVSLSNLYKDGDTMLYKYIADLFNLYEIFQKKRRFVIYPNFITYDEYYNKEFKVDNKQFRASWCSGNLITSYSLFKVCNNMVWLEKEKFYYNEVIKLLFSDIKEYNLQLPIICHGYSFPLILMNKLLRDRLDSYKLYSLDLNKFKNRKMELSYKLINILEKGDINFIVEKYFFGDYSFLTGVVGVILTLIQNEDIFNEDCGYLLDELLNI